MVQEIVDHDTWCIQESSKKKIKRIWMNPSSQFSPFYQVTGLDVLFYSEIDNAFGDTQCRLNSFVCLLKMAFYWWIKALRVGSLPKMFYEKRKNKEEGKEYV